MRKDFFFIAENATKTENVNALIAGRVRTAPLEGVKMIAVDAENATPLTISALAIQAGLERTAVLRDVKSLAEKMDIASKDSATAKMDTQGLIVCIRLVLTPVQGTAFATREVVNAMKDFTGKIVL